MNVRKWIIGGVVGAASLGGMAPAIAAVGQAPPPVISSDQPTDELIRPPETDRCVTDHVRHPNDRCPYDRRHDRCITDHIRHANDRWPPRPATGPSDRQSSRPSER